MSCAPALGRPQRGALPQKTYATVEPDGSNCLKRAPDLAERLPRERDPVHDRVLVEERLRLDDRDRLAVVLVRRRHVVGHVLRLREDVAALRLVGRPAVRVPRETSIANRTSTPTKPAATTRFAARKPLLCTLRRGFSTASAMSSPRGGRFSPARASRRRGARPGRHRRSLCAPRPRPRSSRSPCGSAGRSCAPSRTPGRRAARRGSACRGP